MYQDIILRHARTPFGWGTHPSSHREEGLNTLCGDRITLSAQMCGDSTLHLLFESGGCALCRASASIMVHEMQGRSVVDVATLVLQVRARLSAMEPLESPPWSSDLAALSDMRRYPSRARCVLLAWETLDKMLTRLMSESPASLG